MAAIATALDVVAAGNGPVLALSLGGDWTLAGGVFDMDTWSAEYAAGDTSSLRSTMTPGYEALFRAGVADDRPGRW